MDNKIDSDPLKETRYLKREKTVLQKIEDGDFTPIEKLILKVLLQRQLISNGLSDLEIRLNTTYSHPLVKLADAQELQEINAHLSCNIQDILTESNLITKERRNELFDWIIQNTKKEG
ncbi:hypothetical protein K9M59_02660 [Candidatus Gracilibacteria bacterium]|nr:hypothetical protein [Candidatus Gracilibacteria bacterium]MCF7819234.1 hypothetical protein [Candidatus Gracilibacteria bacterium]